MCVCFSPFTVHCWLKSVQLTLCMLEHSTTVDLLTAVIDTLHRFATLWASMDLMGSIINGLYSAHHLWKIRGIQSRALLALLMEFDHGRYLTETSREQILADISSFTLVGHESIGVVSALIVSTGTPAAH